VLLHFELFIDASVFVAIEEIASLTLSSKIFLGQEGWIAFNVLELEAINLGEPTVIESK
jgi:hypothetical protein